MKTQAVVVASSVLPEVPKTFVPKPTKQQILRATAKAMVAERVKERDKLHAEAKKLWPKVQRAALRLLTKLAKSESVRDSSGYIDGRGYGDVLLLELKIDPKSLPAEALDTYAKMHELNKKANSISMT